MQFDFDMFQSREAVTEAFQLFDTDNDGKIASTEVGTAIRSLGHVITDGQLRQLLGKAGVDRTYQIFKISVYEENF